MNETAQGLIILVAMVTIGISFFVHADKSRRAHCKENGHRWMTFDNGDLYCGHCGTEPNAR